MTKQITIPMVGGTLALAHTALKAGHTDVRLVLRSGFKVNLTLTHVIGDALVSVENNRVITIPAQAIDLAEFHAASGG